MEDDKLPKQFCYDCTIKIESSYTFITEAQKADAILRNIVSRSNISIIVEIESHTKNLTFSNDQTVINDQFNNSPYCNEILSDNVHEMITNECETQEISFAKNNINTDNKIDKTVIYKNKNTNETKNVDVENNIDKNNVCPLCRKSFATKAWFTKHMQKEHLEYACTHCSKSKYSV